MKFMMPCFKEKVKQVVRSENRVGALLLVREILVVMRDLFKSNYSDKSITIPKKGHIKKDCYKL